MNISDAVRNRILEICKQENLTVNALSNKAGITQSTVNDIVNGTTHNIGIATIKKLCDGIDISIREFFNSTLFENLELEIK